MMSLLELVGIPYLVEREGGWDAVQQWENVLSLEALYRAAKERGITSITISQRLALEEFHTRELRMGDCEGKTGWKIREIIDDLPLQGEA
eukprot:Stramenopile-MAST_4_protein_6850